MYTAKEIEAELKSMLQPHRKREYLDKRNYLIGILSHKYNMTEEHIAAFTNLDRCTIHACKHHALNLIHQNNISFLNSVEDYINKFPYTFPESSKVVKNSRAHTVVITLSDDTYKQLKRYKEIKEITTANVAGREVIEKFLKLWEE